MKELLKLENVCLNYQTKTSETQAVKNLNFTLSSGEFIAIIGPSGCGKTSILSMISGLVKPTSGLIKLNDKLITCPQDEIGYMFQKDQLFGWRTIEKNVLLPLEIKRKLTAENVNYASELINKYGLKEFVKYYPHQLSGGMRQRVALIRTLTQKPEILLLDEPFSALDYQTRLSVCDDVYDIIKKENKTSILVTHDISEAISVADKVLVLTKRPASILSVHIMEFDKNLLPLKRREQEKFSKYFEVLYKELNNEKT